MQVKEVMSSEPVVCNSETRLSDVAKMMVDNDCGALPVVEENGFDKILIGMITDRDIVCRVVAADKNPLEARVRDCMSVPAAYAKTEDDLETCLETMAHYQVRRIPVVDDNNNCVGIVTQAQVAEVLTDEKVGALIKRLSEKSERASRVSASAR